LIDRLIYLFTGVLNVMVSQVEKELKDICRDVLDILDKHLIPAASSGESKVFYYKMYAMLDVL